MSLRNITFSLAVTAGLLSPSLSLAQDAFVGTYAGVKAGISLFDTKGRTNLGPFRTSEDGGAFGVILGGRTAVSNQFIVGVEAEGSYQTLYKGWRYGAYGLTGIQTGDSGFAFARLGYSKLDNDLIDLDGIALGIGYEHELSENFNFRVDIGFFPYKDLTVNNVTTSYNGYEMTAGAIFKF